MSKMVMQNTTLNQTYRISFLYTLKINEQTLSATYDLRTYQLAWHEIASIQPNLKGSGLIVSNADQNIKIYINPNLKEYEEVVAIIKSKCPKIWGIQDIQNFRYDYSIQLILLFNCIALSLVAFSEISKGFSFQSIFAILCSVSLFVWILLSTRRQLYFSGDSIVLQYITGKKQIINAGEIIAMQNYDLFTIKLGKKPFSILFPNQTLLKLKTGKTLKIGGVREGKQVFESALKKWLTMYTLVITE